MDSATDSAPNMPAILSAQTSQQPGGDIDLNDRPVSPTGHRQRITQSRWFPLLYQDILPGAPPLVSPSSNWSHVIADTSPDLQSNSSIAPHSDSSGLSRVCHIVLMVHDKVHTAPNIFGLVQEFYDKPSYDLDADLTLKDLAGLMIASQAATESHASCSVRAAPSHTQPSKSQPGVSFALFKNMLQYLLSK
jgi:hypothetical protein